MTDPMSPAGAPGQVAAALQGLVQFRAGAPPGDTRKPAVEPSQSSDRAAASPQDALTLLDRLERTPRISSATPPSLEEAAKAFRDYLKGLPSNLQFHADSDSGYYVFKVVNPVTQEVIRQYPPDEMLELAKRIKESLAEKGAGILLDKQS